MEMYKLNVTINRLHKIVERINAVRNRAHADLQKSLQAAIAITGEQKNLIQPFLDEQRAKVAAAKAQINLADDAILAIRKTIAERNVRLGIADLLADVADLAQRKQRLERTITTALMMHRIGKRQDVINNIDSNRSRYQALSALNTEHSVMQMNVLSNERFAVPAFDGEELDAERAGLEEITRRINQIHDRIAGLNANTADVEIPLTIAQAIGLV